MEFKFSIFIERPPSAVFAFLRDKDQFQQPEGSPVLKLEKLTPGPVGVGSRYREVVQMLPFFRGEILSEVRRYEPNEHLDEWFQGAGMTGYLAYHFSQEGQGTRLIQEETITVRKLFKPFESFIRRSFSHHVQDRLEGIKQVLESGWTSVSR